MNTKAFDDFLYHISRRPLRVIDSSVDLNDYCKLDLSTTNSDLDSIDVSSSTALEHYINSYLNEHNAQVAFGGYLERRAIYSRSAYFKQDESQNERTIHLGIDLWSNAGTEVLSVLDGEIQSFQNNTNFGDYGPTIIVKHHVQNVEFYSLYGHLSLNSIQDIKVGQQVYQGESIGYLGDNTVNGDYAPHLHFQLIRDIGKMYGDYPGVSSEKDLEFYKQNCADPNLLLKLI